MGLKTIADNIPSPCPQPTRPRQPLERAAALVGSSTCTVMITATNLPAVSFPTAPWLRHSSVSTATVMLSSSSSLCLVRMSAALPCEALVSLSILWEELELTCGRWLSMPFLVPADPCGSGISSLNYSDFQISPAEGIGLPSCVCVCVNCMGAEQGH